MSIHILKFEETGLGDIGKVGGKNASLGEMFQKLKSNGINVPDGFATTASAYREFLQKNSIENPLMEVLSELDTIDFSNLHVVGEKARSLILKGTLPLEISDEIIEAYRELCNKYNQSIHVAVRSSATAEDLPDASFAGQHDSYLNISGEEQLLQAVVKCYASLFNDRAIKYRHDHGFEHMKVALSVGIQKMVRSDKGSAGVCFTIDPETGFDNVILITGSWGLGENVVQGAVNPDEFYVFKPSLRNGKKSLISKKPGTKLKTMIYGDSGLTGQPVINTDTPEDKTRIFILTEEEITKIAGWSLAIEDHYKRPMDIEWAKDGETGEIFIVQARPETVYGKSRTPLTVKQFELKQEGRIIVRGKGIGNKIASGVARIIRSPEDSDQLKQGEVLVTDITNPDWDPVMKKASAIITNRGGRTSHAAIVARELGAVAVVGSGNATEVIKDGDEITVSCEDGINGIVYAGKLEWEEKDLDFRDIKMPQTEAKLILADPDKAFHFSMYPNNGVGLLRLEFIISNSIRIHPMALARFDLVKDASVQKEIESLTYLYPDKKEYFTDKLSQAVGTIAAAFYPREVIVRMSDFKTNEYANLIGGKDFEPREENPMLGFRGASRYYNPAYREGFALECEAMKIVRDEMGFTNVKLMIPFCRTVEEGVKVLQTMEQYGLVRGRNQLEIYMMVEIPSNVILAEEFARIFDGFSIGSNDLTQLTLGLDRDSYIISELFSERNQAVKELIGSVIRTARKSNTPVGLCGQAPSDFPDFAEFLVTEGIDSISFNPDALLNGINHMVHAENKIRSREHIAH
jgi:pyruvate, water dikinase